MNRSTSGSTMTINSIGNGNNNNNNKDDVSIYNGDENHKVWAGSQDNLDTIYDVYAPSTISRPSRPRQIAQPVTVPPPPTKDKTKKKQKKKDASPPLMHNGTKASSVSGGTRAPPPRGPPPPQPVYIMAHPHQQTLPNPKFFKGNTFSHRPRRKMLIPARPIPPPLVPMAPMILPATMQKNRKKSKLAAMEEPIYMPSNRALSPVASYQPVNFPHEAYLMQHYATMEGGLQGGKHRKRGDKGGKMNKKLAQSMNGLDDPHLGGQSTVGAAGGQSGDESPFNTGIYRKKGHLNERAFSYSIRQEHRSRSYGSLANLKFATPIPNGEVSFFQI